MLSSICELCYAAFPFRYRSPGEREESSNKESHQIAINLLLMETICLKHPNKW
jgi:hypothetical protein